MPAIKFKRRKKFHQFIRLPPEIRRRVWYWCLPRRIVEPDVLDGKRHEENSVRTESGDCGHICECYQKFKVKSSRRPPLIMRVCREAYDVAADHGAIDTTAGPLATWRQPGLDRMLFFHGKIHRRLWYGAYSRHHRSDTSRVCRLVDAFAHARRTSLPLAFYHLEIYPFEFEDTLALDGWKSKVFEPQMAFLGTFAQLGRNTTFPCAVMTVVLHVAEQQAAQSGLFGRLGEEPCQLVPVEDASRINEYHEFWLANSSYQPNVAQATRIVWSALLDEADLRARINTWLATLHPILLAAAWLMEAARPPNNQHLDFNENTKTIYAALGTDVAA
ncbi:hypothetical protein PWT90_01912 [Aphanocladium album]|nr:hypothetical protein PWT90_01912 [Aphanocladium album]